MELLEGEWEYLKKKKKKRNQTETTSFPLFEFDPWVGLISVMLFRENAGVWK
jgi:hypothetical protein